MESTAGKRVAALLEEGETVLWTGRPTALAFVLGGMVLTVPLGAIAVGSATSWSAGAGLTALPTWAKVVVAVVLAFAGHMLVLRPMLGLYIAYRTSYVITDRRALVVCEAWSGRVQQLRHDEGELVAVKGLKGFGKIQFGRTASSSLDVLLFGRAAIPGFYGLQNVDDPLATLRRQRGADRRPT